MEQRKRKVPADGVSREAAKPTLQGVSRALRVLELLAKQPMRAIDAAEYLGMPWATLHRTLAQLENDEFIERDQSGVYRVGRRTWLLGSTYLVGHRILELAIPHVRAAAPGVPNAVLQIAERSEGTAVVLYSHEATSGEIITRTTYGYHFPLHSGSKGHVLLAYASEDFIEHYLAQYLVALTPATVTDPGKLREILAEVRQRKFARTVGDVQTFTGSVAVPIFDASGAVPATVCAIVPRSQMNGKRNEEVLIETVQRVAQGISLGLGWQPMQSARHGDDVPVV